MDYLHLCDKVSSDSLNLAQDSNSNNREIIHKEKDYHSLDTFKKSQYSQNERHSHNCENTSSDSTAYNCIFSFRMHFVVAIGDIDTV